MLDCFFLFLKDTKVVSVFVRKEAYKFSAAHMTVFPDGTKESLHGHNYEVELKVTLRDPSFGKTLAFSSYKEILKKISSRWDEKLLLAQNNPFFKITGENEDSLSFELCGKKYTIPRNEIAMLACDNITTENLSQIYLKEFLKELNADAKVNLKSIQIRISEYRHQGSECYQEL